MNTNPFKLKSAQLTFHSVWWIMAVWGTCTLVWNLVPSWRHIDVTISDLFHRSIMLLFESIYLNDYASPPEWRLKTLKLKKHNYMPQYMINVLDCSSPLHISHKVKVIDQAGCWTRLILSLINLLIRDQWPACMVIGNQWSPSCSLIISPYMGVSVLVKVSSSPFSFRFVLCNPRPLPNIPTVLSPELPWFLSSHSLWPITVLQNQYSTIDAQNDVLLSMTNWQLINVQIILSVPGWTLYLGSLNMSVWSLDFRIDLVMLFLFI